MTSEVALIERIDRLRAESAEKEWFEFKRNKYAPQDIGEYLSALSNGACLAAQPHGYLIFGIDDESHEVVGTQFDPYKAKGKGSQNLLHWLEAGLSPNPGLVCQGVDHAGGRLVVFEVGPAPGRPVKFYGKAFVRVGSSKTSLDQHPAKEKAIWARGTDWSALVCESASLADLDDEAIAAAREQFAVKHPAQADDVGDWDDETFLNKARLLKQGSVTNAALVLLGRAESTTLLSPAVVRISWILKDENNREQDYEHFDPPFLLAGDRLQKRLRNLTVRELPSGSLFPQEITQYDAWVIREALHNCIAHQDYGLFGRIVVVESPDRVLLTNVGDFLPGDVHTVIEQDSPQPVYRNPFLAQAMVELNLIDTQGGGIKRMFETQRKRSFPLPDYDLSKPDQVTVSIPGRILDERYTRLLMERTDLTLAQVVLLDQVQKGRRIEKQEHQRLKRSGLVEGRYPNLIVAGPVAKVTGGAAQHIRQRGLEKKYYLDLIVELIKEHGPVSRKDVDDLLFPKLSERLSHKQKKNKVANLLQELSREGRIENEGSRGLSGSWVISRDL